MKQKFFDKKLLVKKITISNLSNEEQGNVYGGGTVWGRTCDNMPITILGHHCVLLPATVWGRTCNIDS